jgi:hypothetical protein
LVKYKKRKKNSLNSKVRQKILETRVPTGLRQKLRVANHSIKTDNNSKKSAQKQSHF